jgi:hypothetical protein
MKLQPDIWAPRVWWTSTRSRYFEMISRRDKYFSPAGIRFREFVTTYLR